MQHSLNWQRTLPFSSRCLFGARSPQTGGGGGGGHDPAPSEPEAPGVGGVDGEDGWDMAASRSCRIESRGEPQNSFPSAPICFPPGRTWLIPQAHGRIDLSPAKPHEQVPPREMPVGRVPEAQRIGELGALAARIGLCIAESEPGFRLVKCVTEPTPSSTRVFASVSMLSTVYRHPFRIALAA